jgi:Na+/H+-translocating membrane pyrophosphatase
MGKKQNENYFQKLVKEDNNVSALNFFLIATLAVGVILLFVPIIGMLVDIWFNHTMTINLSDMALYIGAVAGIFASGGLTSAWTEFSYSKFKVPPLDENGRPIKDDNHNGIPDDQEDDIDPEEELVVE